MHFSGVRSLHFFCGVGNEQEFPRRTVQSRGDFRVAWRCRLEPRVSVEIRRDVGGQVAGYYGLKELLLREDAARRIDADLPLLPAPALKRGRNIRIHLAVQFSVAESLLPNFPLYGLKWRALAVSRDQPARVSNA